MEVSFIWLYLAAILTILTFLLVPVGKIKELLGFGLVGGFLLAVIVQIIGISLNLWSYNSGFLVFYNFPLGVALMWFPAVVIFAYFFNNGESLMTKILVIFGWSFITALITYGSVQYGFREFIHWNIYYDLILAVFLHSILGYYLFIKRREVV
ncbi:MAG: CBO0543 family protein [bacterium]